MTTTSRHETATQTWAQRRLRVTAPVRDQKYERIHVAPLTPVIGAEVEGVDLANGDDETWAEVETAYADHLVLFFRNQDLSPSALAGVARRFGEPHVHPAAAHPDGFPEVMFVHADERSEVVAGNSWHSDVSCDEQPPSASLLWLHTVPDLGGDTLFSSMYAAYDALSDGMKEILAGKTASHESAHVYGGHYRGAEDKSRDRTYPSAIHPVVRTHPVTGKKALYVNRVFTTRICEVSGAESAALLPMLYDHQENIHFQCRFRWQANTLAVWDNRCAQHAAVWDYYPAVRSGYRASVVGERPV